ncbi:protein kinase [Wenzhouxiangella sp. XN201]|uniref:serine/threonine-protein kinase n=1 Tax=Wenzhouxiangella sp. XN201 TaxID=2710755 RepID=UPI0013C68C7B|nr:serine/threonine-protein kinase [Wenzhouxiangella sp. XN201]NEZ03150.1 protein kinase [Wenzhouxiangella sp. XN201]
MSKQGNGDFETGGGLRLFLEMAGSDGQALIDRTLGNYRITALIAEGGMSRVYRAERIDGSFSRDVAIKLSPASSMNPEYRERFLREQSVLASLNHPNIGQLYDAQVTEEGWPYIVMELIDGVPVDEWCQTNRASPKTIVRMMIGVVEALAYAHARLIVHRDIKPSNVLVNSEGQPKLLDFGIAKDLQSDFTDAGQITPMTPRYASPEQLLGKEITVGSDIYQLGFLLLELLTGESQKLYDDLSDAITRAANRQEVTLPESVRTKLPDELLLIIEKCLRASPNERYRDANALKGDLEAWLGGFPISAARPGTGYRLRKLAARNKAASLVSALSVAIILVSGLWYTHSLSEARMLAEQRAETSNRVLQAMSDLVSETFTGLIDANAERQSGGAAHVHALLEEAVAVVRRELSTESGARAELLRVQGTIEMVLGDLHAARATLEEAAQLVDHSESPETAFQILLDRLDLASRGIEVDAMRELLDDASALVERHDFDVGLLARYHIERGNILQAEQEHDDAIARFNEALALLEQSQPRDYRTIADTHREIAFTYSNSHRHEEAIEHASRAVAILEEHISPATHLLIHPLRQIGWSRLALHKIDEAREPIERALFIARANFGELHSDVAAAYATLATLSYRNRQFEDAIHNFNEHVRITSEVEGADSANLLTSYASLGVMHADIGQMDQAARYNRLVLESVDPEKPESRLYRASTLSNEARRLFAIGDYDASVESYETALDIAREIYEPDAFQLFEWQQNMSLGLLRAGRIEAARSKFIENLRLYGESRGIDSEFYKSWQWNGWEFDLLEGNLDAARKKLEQSIQGKVERGDIGVIYWAEQLATLASICMQQDDMPCARQALDWAAQGAELSPTHPWAYFVQIVEAEYWSHEGNDQRAAELAGRALEGLTEKYPLHTDRIDRAQALLEQVKHNSRITQN